MLLVEWDDTLLLGVKQIDAHHEKLVSILNQCYRALMLNDHQHELEAIVTELRNYTMYHFQTEENIMSEVGYLEAPSHAQMHQKFIASIYDFQARLQYGESFIAVELLTFLKDWLVEHIQRTDRALADFILAKEAS